MPIAPSFRKRTADCFFGNRCINQDKGRCASCGDRICRECKDIAICKECGKRYCDKTACVELANLFDSNEGMELCSGCSEFHCKTHNWMVDCEACNMRHCHGYECTWKCKSSDKKYYDFSCETTRPTKRAKVSEG